MADNTILNSGTGGVSLADDDIGGVKYPRIKLIHGADGVNAGMFRPPIYIRLSRLLELLLWDTLSFMTNGLPRAILPDHRK